MEREYTNLEKVRLEKAEQLRGQGVDPYPAYSERSHYNQAAIQAFEASEASGDAETVLVTLVGRIRSMRAMGKIPGALNLMKPMFPVLFPRLLPMMMPKVMDNLLPHMVADVVPLVTPPMIAYLRGKQAKQRKHLSAA